MIPSPSPKAMEASTVSEPRQKAKNLLIESYLRLIEDQNRLLAAEERAMEEERLHLAELPELVDQFEQRLSRESDPKIRDILNAKLDEARADLIRMQQRMTVRESAWPARKAALLADIARFHEKLGQSTAASQR